jgi:hypothetical protein
MSSVCVADPADEPADQVAQAATAQATPVDDIAAAEANFRASVLASVSGSAAAAA